ncbi:hypothetical protein [Curtobacterium sp. Curtsp57]|uniref:phage tail tube protein n=1 Tax=Curtobacterium sp. Curtsp57 TaxID=3243047 RepID=UPI0039B3F765
MPADAGTLVVPGHGTVFTAPKNTPMPTAGPSAFGLNAAPTGWVNIGHTSQENMVSFSTDGGDATALSTWLQDNVRTIYAATSWSLGINALQLDKPNLDLAFNGEVDEDGGYIVPGSNGGLEMALFVLAVDTTGKLGFYIPNTSTKLGDSPSFDTENFLELPLSSSIQAADEAVIPALADGRGGIMKIYPPKALEAA